MPVIVGIAVIAIIAIVVVAYVMNKSPTNTPDGKSCVTNKECASGSCNDGTCGPPPCTVSGLPCTSDSNCCSGAHCLPSGMCSQPDSWVAVSGYNVSATGGAQESSKSLAECEAECIDDCLAITYFPGADDNSGGCAVVKSMPAMPLNTPDATSYFKKSANKTLTLPRSFVGQGGRSYQNTDVAACDTMCKQAGTSCVAYSVDSNKTCWLAPNLDLLNTGDNSTSYVL